MAENTGRSGQPVQKVGGRGGSGAPSALSTSACCASTLAIHWSSAGVDAAIAGAERRRGPCRPPAACTRPPSAARPCRAACVLRSALRRIWPIACSRKSGAPSSITSTAFLPAQKRGDLVGHQRMHDVEHERRQRDVAVGVAQAGESEAAVQHIEQPALHDDADVAVGRAQRSLSLFSTMNLCAAGSRRATLSASWRKVAGGCARRS